MNPLSKVLQLLNGVDTICIAKDFNKILVMDSSNVANLRSKAAIFSAIDTFVIFSASTLGNLDIPKPSVTNKGNLLSSDNFLKPGMSSEWTNFSYLF